MKIKTTPEENIYNIYINVSNRKNPKTVERFSEFLINVYNFIDVSKQYRKSVDLFKQIDRDYITFMIDEIKRLRDLFGVNINMRILDRHCVVVFDELKGSDIIFGKTCMVIDLVDDRDKSDTHFMFAFKNDKDINKLSQFILGEDVYKDGKLNRNTENKLYKEIQEIIYNDRKRIITNKTIGAVYYMLEEALPVKTSNFFKVTFNSDRAPIAYKKIDFEVLKELL